MSLDAASPHTGAGLVNLGRGVAILGLGWAGLRLASRPMAVEVDLVPDGAAAASSLRETSGALINSACRMASGPSIVCC